MPLLRSNRRNALPSAPDAAVLQGLDKTARVTTIDAPIGQAVRFGTLDITVRKCHRRPPTETPETTVYLEIRERRLGENAVDLFAGWMFASSPAASSMEHPVYDVWVVDCKKLRVRAERFRPETTPTCRARTPGSDETPNVEISTTPNCASGPSRTAYPAIQIRLFRGGLPSVRAPPCSHPVPC